MAAVMNKNLNPADLGQALEQALTIYSSEITARIDAAGEESMEKLSDCPRRMHPPGGVANLNGSLPCQRSRPRTERHGLSGMLNPPNIG